MERYRIEQVVNAFGRVVWQVVRRASGVVYTGFDTEAEAEAWVARQRGR